MNTFSVQQKTKPENLDVNLLLRQNKLHLMSRFMEIASINTKLGQIQTATELGSSSSTLQRYRYDIKI